MSQGTFNFENRYKAEQAVCDAFADLGNITGINVSKGDGPPDLDKDLIDACRQCYFGDPHFFGGPGVIVRADSLLRVEQIFTPAFDVSGRLLRYIKNGEDPAKIKRAEKSVAVISSAHVWLKKIVKA